jgi:hypothetical protein
MTVADVLNRAGVHLSDVHDTFDAVWDENDEKSTEWLIAMTADRCGISYDQVVDALYARHVSTAASDQKGEG